MNIVRLNYDRWRISILQQSLARFGIAIPLQECGQGLRTRAPALKLSRRSRWPARFATAATRCCDGVLAMRSCPGTPPANRKLDKARSYGRIDAAVAAVMAIGAMKAVRGAGDRDRGADRLTNSLLIPPTLRGAASFRPHRIPLHFPFAVQPLSHRQRIAAELMGIFDLWISSQLAQSDLHLGTTTNF